MYGYVFPVNSTKAYTGCRSIAPVFRKPSHKTEVTVQRQSPVALPRGSSPWYRLNEKLVGIWRRKESLAPYVIEPPTFQLVSSSLCSVRYASLKFIFLFVFSRGLKSLQIAEDSRLRNKHMSPNPYQFLMQFEL
jgi:hypothetical protein